MPDQAQSAHVVDKEQSQERGQRVMHNDRSSLVRSIASAVVIKDKDVCFLCNRSGRVPTQAVHGLGLYYHDCRFLNGYELRLADTNPNPLTATAAGDFQANLELTNPDLHLADGSLLQKEDLGITWERVVDGTRLTLNDRFTFRNYKLQPIRFSITLCFGAKFEDIFTVRGMPTKKRGKLRPPEWKDGALRFVYDGADKLRRSLTIRFDPAPERQERTEAHFEIALDARESKQIRVTLELREVPATAADQAASGPLPDFAQVAASLRQAAKEWLGKQTRVHSDSHLLNRVLQRSLADLYMLRSRLNERNFFAAGVPWYVTLFGRDSLIAGFQTLAYEPEVAERMLRLLAEYQGTKVDEWRDEAPGKIMHELRVGEMAHLNEIPQTPYYGTVDATPLFLILLARHADWTGSLDLFHDLLGNVERALNWMAHYGDEGTGYLTYESKSKKGLGNQGWKDSGDSIMNADGSLAKPPVALAEVQGYAYLAKTGIADLYRRAGQVDRADQLRKEADDLRQRFNRDFWLKDLGIYALALQAGGKPCAVVASNAGQVLWSGIADPDKASKTKDHLMAEDMFSGWGIRTLSSKARRYNPVGYQLGAVWPHDNSLILAGFRNYGFDDEARRICAGLVEAATNFRGYRLPEVFCGFSQEQFAVPVRYPVACHPQAWAAGAVPFILTTLLGLTADGFGGKLHIVRPLLPDLANWVEVEGLRVGGGRAHLRFERAGDKVEVKVLEVEGKLEVVSG